MIDYQRINGNYNKDDDLEQTIVIKIMRAATLRTKNFCEQTKRIHDIAKGNFDRRETCG